jgi:hypothetical protein
MPENVTPSKFSPPCERLFISLREQSGQGCLAENNDRPDAGRREE